MFGLGQRHYASPVPMILGAPRSSKVSIAAAFVLTPTFHSLICHCRCRSQLNAEGNGASITPVDDPALDGPPEDPTQLKSPLARALRAITVWLPGGLAAIAYEERKPQRDPEAGSPAATPRTPKDP